MADDLRRLPWLIRLSRATLARIRQNIILAILTKVLVLILALGLANLWMAIAADVGTSLVVVANSLRLLTRLNRRTQQLSLSLKPCLVLFVLGTVFHGNILFSAANKRCDAPGACMNFSTPEPSTPGVMASGSLWPCLVSSCFGGVAMEIAASSGASWSTAWP
jgi:hypothetical protein